MAIASWIESGIHQKMEKDIAFSKAVQGQIADQFWVPQKLLTNNSRIWVPEQLLTNEVLTMNHALPAFIIHGIGLVPAAVAFIFELLHHKFEKRTANKRRIWMT